MQEIFGPIVTVYVYPDEKYREIAELANETSPFALTGAIYAGDKYVKFYSLLTISFMNIHA